jgi:hypothetical protein
MTLNDCPIHVQTIARILALNGFAVYGTDKKLKMLSIQQYWESVGIFLGIGWLKYSDMDAWVIDNSNVQADMSSDPRIRKVDRIIKNLKSNWRTEK